MVESVARDEAKLPLVTCSSLVMLRTLARPARFSRSRTWYWRSALRRYQHAPVERGDVDVDPVAEGAPLTRLVARSSILRPRPWSRRAAILVSEHRGARAHRPISTSPAATLQAGAAAKRNADSSFLVSESTESMRRTGMQREQVHLLDAHGALVRHAHVDVLRPRVPRHPAPSLPVSATIRSPSSRATRIAATTLAEFPEVEIASSTSPLRPSARSCFANTCS